MTEKQYGVPLIVPDFGESPARSLKRIRLEKTGKDGYQERWLQKLISCYPTVLPINQIEPAFAPAISICMELPLASGFVDNLYATPDGDLILGETKLFRNPEARREVVGQIIDYAKDLSALSYEDLEDAISKAEGPEGGGCHPKVTLYEAIASGHEEKNEEDFIDAVSRNLERGRFLLLIVGDGIREGAESIAAFLQQHAGMHFTLGLVDLAVFELPNEIGGYLVQPRILARTKMIDRGIVSIENGRITAKPPLDQTINPKGRRTTISEEKFYEEMAAALPAIAPRLKSFASQLEAIGIAIEFGKGTMILRWRPDETPWNLGSISTFGRVWTDVVNGKPNAVGLLSLSHAYLKRLASLVPGAQVRETPKPTAWYVAKDGKYITLDDLLDHKEGWLAAIKDFMAAATDALKDR